MSTETMERRLREFVAETGESDWSDVLARAGKRRARLPLGRVVLAAAVCVAAAGLAAFLSGASRSTHSGGTPPPPMGPGPHFESLKLHMTPASGRLTSIDVTVNAATLGGTVLVEVVKNHVASPENATPDQIVFQERVPMTDIPSPVSGPPGLELLSTWSGTLSPGDWKGGCEDGPYVIYVQVSPRLNPLGDYGGESIQSGPFSCSSFVPFT
jgi:hypothetical protein